MMTCQHGHSSSWRLLMTTKFGPALKGRPRNFAQDDLGQDDDLREQFHAREQPAAHELEDEAVTSSESSKEIPFLTSVFGNLDKA